MQQEFQEKHKIATQSNHFITNSPQGALNLLKQLLPLDQEWVAGKVTEGFKTFKKEDKATGIMYARGEGFIPYTIEQISAILEDHNNKKQIDELSDEEYQLQSLGGKAEIVYCSTQSMYVVISGRDFILAMDTFVEGEIHYKVAKSIDYPHPAKKDKVRGEIILAGWQLEPRQGGTYCIYIIQVDPKGNIPTKATNLAAEVQADVTRNIKKALDKKYNKQ